MGRRRTAAAAALVIAAGLALARAPEVAALKAHLDRMTALDERTKAAHEKGAIGERAVAAAAYYRAEARLWLEQERARRGHL